MDRRRFLLKSARSATFLAVLPACGGAKRKVTIAAAADLRDALQTLKPRLEAVAGSRISIVFGSSGLLKEQIQGGARYDLYLSADAGFVRELQAAGRTLETAVYAVGRLALAWREGLEPLSAIDDLARPGIERIAIAQPSHAPYGRAAKEALTSSGLWEELLDRIAYAENVRQATDYVAGGNADAGLVALALVIKASPAHITVPAVLHQPIVQAGAVIEGTAVESQSRDILAFLLGPEAQAALAGYGFEEAPAT